MDKLKFLPRRWQGRVHKSLPYKPFCPEVGHHLSHQPNPPISDIVPCFGWLHCPSAVPGGGRFTSPGEHALCEGMLANLTSPLGTVPCCHTWRRHWALVTPGPWREVLCSGGTLRAPAVLPTTQALSAMIIFQV